MKALEKDRSRRYETANGFAMDVQRYLADEPVQACPPSAGYRLGKFVRRNRVPLAAGAALAVTVLAGGVAVLTVQARANSDLRRASERTRRERDLARQNFDLARRAVDDYLTRIGQNPLLKERGLHDLRQELLEAALHYYGDFLGQRGDDPGLRAEAAAAHERVGDILIELGRPGDALAAYNQALALLDPLARDRPGDPVVATARVRLHAGRLQALRIAGSYSDALAAFDLVTGSGESLLDAAGGTEDLDEILARTYDGAVLMIRETKGIDDALRASLRAQALADRAARERPGDLSAARTLLGVTVQASVVLRTKGRADEARRLCEQAIAFGRARVDEHPRDIEMRMNLARLESVLGDLERSQGRRIEALKSERSAAETLGALAREHPQLISIRTFWANSLFGLSIIQNDLGRYAEAERSARASIDQFEMLAREVPSSSLYRNRSGDGYAVLGTSLRGAGSHGEALAAFRKATAILEKSESMEDLYNLACVLAMASTIADPAEGPAAERRRRDADRAVATIRRVIEMGFADSDTLRNDPQLGLLRSRPDFQLLLMDLAFPADPFSKDQDAVR
jgi:serine/threonine-protein kinase